jgi:hypothetical protein
MDNYPRMSDQIQHIGEIIKLLELRAKDTSPDSRQVYAKAIDDLKESIALLQEQINSGREANEGFWQQHQKRIDDAWHDVLVHVLNERGEAGLSTTE